MRCAATARWTPDQNGKSDCPTEASAGDKGRALRLERYQRIGIEGCLASIVTSGVWSMRGNLSATLLGRIQAATANFRLYGTPYPQPVSWLHQRLACPNGDPQRIIRHCDLSQNSNGRRPHAVADTSPAGQTLTIDLKQNTHF
jgi:hypothetical protein